MTLENLLHTKSTWRMRSVGVSKRLGELLGGEDDSWADMVICWSATDDLRPESTA